MTNSDPFAGLDSELRERLQRVMSPAHMAQFVTSADPPEIRWRPYKHLMLINRELVRACTSPDQEFLNVAVSVRHGKSELISRYLPVWYLLLYPHRQVIIVSYNENKAAEWGQFTRDVFRHWAPMLAGLELGDDSKLNWSVKGHRGGCRAVGVGGSITGIGGDLIVIDDPIKNREEADSQAGRNALWGWYGSTIRTRLMPEGTLVLTMARWHEDDLTGRIQNMMSGTSDPWRFILLPALAEAPKDADPDVWTDELGRHEGDALWPEKWPAEMLARARASIDPSDWQALYQQNPTPPEGHMFKVPDWQIIHDVNRLGLRLCRFWDTAATAGGGDWTVGGLVGVDSENHIFVLDLQRFQGSAAEVEDRMKATAAIDGRSVPVRWEQERAGAGKAITSTYVRMLMGFDAAGVRAEGQKEARARPFASQVQSHNVWLLEAGWNQAFLEEARTFPLGRHDDQIDAVVGAFNYLAEGGFTTMVTQDEAESAASMSFDALLSIDMGRNPFFTGRTDIFS